eukprot:11646997-Heterocapsa_arctica.AAC.1
MLSLVPLAFCVFPSASCAAMSLMDLNSHMREDMSVWPSTTLNQSLLGIRAYLMSAQERWSMDLSVA